MSTLGFSMSAGAGAAGKVPPIGDVDIYLDVTDGDDTADGTSWAEAYLTWDKANDELEKILDSHPKDIHVTIFVRNGTHGAVPAGSYCVSPHVSDRARVHVVQPVDQWQGIMTGGTVPIAGSTAEPGSALAVVAVVGFAPTLAEVGMYLLLTKTVGGFDERVLTTILSVDVVGGAYVVSMLDASMPGWIDDDGLTVAEVLNPYSVVNGEFAFAPTAAQVGDGAQMVDGVFAPQCWLFGMRANSITIGGECAAAVGCSSMTAAGVFGAFSVMSGTGVWAMWTRGAVEALLSDQRAINWGLRGVTTAQGQACGNSCSEFTAQSGSFNSWAGYCEGAWEATNNCGIDATLCHAWNYEYEEGAQGSIVNFRGSGYTNAPMVLAEGNGSYVEIDYYYLWETDKPAASILESKESAEIVLRDGTHARKETVAPANYPLIGYYANGGRIEILAGGVPDEIRSQRQLLLAQDGGFFDITGDIEFDTDPRPGAGAADIQITTGSKMVLRGDIIKDVPNTLPCALLDVSFASQFVQVSGSGGVVHGNAPADWTASYGNLGYIHISDHSSATLGALVDTAVGAGAGIAVQVRRYSSLWTGAQCTVTGAATTKIGSAAPAAFPAVVLNDLPAAPAGTEELCVVGPTATP